MEIETTTVERNMGKAADEATRARRRSDEASEKAEAKERQIATWLLLANGGALLLCFNGLLNRQICDWVAFSPLVHAFFAGLVSAFLAMLLDYYIAIAVRRGWADLADNCEATVRISQDALSLVEPLKELESKPTVSAHQMLSAKLEAAHKEALGAVESRKRLASRIAWQQWIARASIALFGVAMAAFAFGLFSAVTYPQYAHAVCGAVVHG